MLSFLRRNTVSSLSPDRVVGSGRDLRKRGGRKIKLEVGVRVIICFSVSLGSKR